MEFIVYILLLNYHYQLYGTSFLDRRIANIYQNSQFQNMLIVPKQNSFITLLYVDFVVHHRIIYCQSYFYSFNYFKM